MEFFPETPGGKIHSPFTGVVVGSIITPRECSFTCQAGGSNTRRVKSTRARSPFGFFFIRARTNQQPSRLCKLMRSGRTRRSRRRKMIRVGKHEVPLNLALQQKQIHPSLQQDRNDGEIPELLDVE